MAISRFEGMTMSEVRAAVEAGIGIDREQEFCPEYSSPRYITPNTVTSLLDSFNIKIPKPSTESPSDIGNRIFRTAQHYVNDIRFGDKSLGQVCLQPLKNYLGFNSDSNAVSGLEGISIVLKAFEMQTGDTPEEFVGRFRSVTEEEVAEAIEGAYRIEGVDYKLADKGDIFKPKAQELKLPPYQCHLDSAVDCIAPYTDNTSHCQEGAFLGYAIIDTLWTKLYPPLLTTKNTNH